jgi:hypothetical protein
MCLSYAFIVWCDHDTLHVIEFIWLTNRPMEYRKYVCHYQIHIENTTCGAEVTSRYVNLYVGSLMNIVQVTEYFSHLT